MERLGIAVTADQRILLYSSQAGVAIDVIPWACTEEQNYTIKKRTVCCFELTTMKTWRILFGCTFVDVFNPLLRVGCTVTDSSVDSCSPQSCGLLLTKYKEYVAAPRRQDPRNISEHMKKNCRKIMICCPNERINGFVLKHWLGFYFCNILC